MQSDNLPVTDQQPESRTWTDQPSFHLFILMNSFACSANILLSIYYSLETNVLSPGNIQMESQSSSIHGPSDPTHSSVSSSLR